MAKKTANTKVEVAKGRKASSKAEKEQQKMAEVEAKDEAKWAKGSKKNDKKELEAEKKAALLLKKQEAQRILAEEEKNLVKPKAPKPNYTPKKSLFTTERVVTKKTIPTTLDDDETSTKKVKPILTEKDIEKHPERRFKNALKEYEEREVKNFRAQYPGLRLSQLKEIMYKEFQKSPDNPFNQSNVFSYNSTLEEVNRKLNGEPEPTKEEEEEEEEEEEVDTPTPDNVTVSKQTTKSY
ncbi:hypothetical protein MFLAVUS_006726 [Mucor flavus]|uniref:Uncharacterized protein n=1 Tax=Mucor flavus TaxID=439312 RepID=A0ABP9Z2C4_9FUNG